MPKMNKILKLLIMLTLTSSLKASKEKKQFDLHQNDYVLKFQRIELVRYNKNYVKDMKIVTYKFNRTTAVTNMTATFSIDIGRNLVVVVQAYKFMSNEYRYFPVRMAANACKALDANVGGCQSVYSCGNFTGCPLIKEKKYHICNFAPDGSKLPPFIPNGEYKMEMQGMYFSTELYLVGVYSSITRPIVIP